MSSQSNVIIIFCYFLCADRHDQDKKPMTALERWNNILVLIFDRIYNKIWLLLNEQRWFWKSAMTQNNKYI